MFIKKLQNNIKNFCEKEVTFSTKNKHLFSFRPALILQGFLIVFVFLFSSFFVINFLSSEKINQSLVISNFETKNRAVVNQATEHIVLIKSSDISQDGYYLKLPKSATNIKVTQISAGRARIALQSYGASPQISDEDRRVLALAGKRTLEDKIGIAGLIAKSAASLSEAIADVVEGISGSDSEGDAQVIKTNDSVYVDLLQVEENIQEPQTESDTPPETEQVAEQITDLSQTTTPSDSGIIATPSEADGEAISTTPEQTNSEIALPPDEAPLNDENIEPEQIYIQVTYETPAPEIVEEKTDTGKLVTVSVESEDAQDPITNVLAFTNIPEIYKVGQESKIKIKWQNNGNQNVVFNAYDTDGNGKLDYVEWTVPHLSEQIFEIIFISKAFRLDENREITEDIYDYVSIKDGNWVALNNGEYIRATFEQFLDSSKDITIYAKPTEPGQAGLIQVYAQDSDNLIVEFPSIDHEDTYRVLLLNLQIPTDVFDLKISGNIDFDYIVDPTITDSFANETKIGAGTTYVNISSGVSIMPCYTPTPSWTKVADTLVRDIAGAPSSTIEKDIYCDDVNCILWTDNAAAPGTVCIATDANVYGNILWSKTNEVITGPPLVQTHTWSDSNFDLFGGDIGGTHPTFSVGNNNLAIGAKNWLERYYSNSAAGMFNSMDLCKARGAGWRLPNIIELDEIRDQAKGSSPFSRLPNIVGNGYWSSSEYSTSLAYYLDFPNGNADRYTKSGSGYVRCVRGY